MTEIKPNSPNKKRILINKIRKSPTNNLKIELPELHEKIKLSEYRLTHNRNNSAIPTCRFFNNKNQNSPQTFRINNAKTPLFLPIKLTQTPKISEDNDTIAKIHVDLGNSSPFFKSFVENYSHAIQSKHKRGFSSILDKRKIYRTSKELYIQKLHEKLKISANGIKPMLNISLNTPKLSPDLVKNVSAKPAKKFIVKGCYMNIEKIPVIRTNSQITKKIKFLTLKLNHNFKKSSLDKTEIINDKNFLTMNSEGNERNVKAKISIYLQSYDGKPLRLMETPKLNETYY